MTQISILDIGLGNIQCVLRAFEHLRREVRFISHADEVKQAEVIVLPGVGAFGDGMQKLRNLQLIDPLGKHVEQSKPLMGICLGMQLFLEGSVEFGEHDGLGYLPGSVVKFSEPEPGTLEYRVPHVGWNTVELEGVSPLFEKDRETDFYFAHSYYVEPESRACVLASSEYGTHRFCAAFQLDNIVGFQFHPEKSGVAGLELLAKWCELLGI